MLVSGQFFQALETPPLLGRYLTPQDDQPGGNPAGLAVVISEDFWNNWFNRAPDVVGRTLVIANTPFTVVGRDAEAVYRSRIRRRGRRSMRRCRPTRSSTRRGTILTMAFTPGGCTVGARLKPGVSSSRPTRQLLTVSNPILHEAGAADASFIAEKEKGHFHFVAEPGSRGYTYARFLFRKPLVAMFAMCGGILLLACLNLASLLMARGVARRARAGHAAGDGRHAPPGDPATADGEPADCRARHSRRGRPPPHWSAIPWPPWLKMAGREMRLDTSLDLRVFFFAALIALASSHPHWAGSCAAGHGGQLERSHQRGPTGQTGTGAQKDSSARAAGIGSGRGSDPGDRRGLARHKPLCVSSSPEQASIQRDWSTSPSRWTSSSWKATP